MSKKKHKAIFNHNQLKGNPFQAPEGYFETINEKVSRKIEMQDNLNPFKEKTLWVLVRPYLAFAASFIGLAFIVYTGINYVSGKYKLNESSKNYISGIMEKELQYINEETFYQMLSHDEETISFEENMEDVIIEYLVNSKVEFDIIINEL